MVGRRGIQVSIPEWLLEIFAGVTLLIAAMSTGHLAVAGAWVHRGAVDADIALFHLLLGIAIAGLLVADLHTLPNAAWDVVFAVTTAWFDWCLWQESREHGAAAICGRYAQQLLYSAAMLYMFTALAQASSGGSVMPGMSGMPGMADGSSGVMPTLRAPTLALVFTVLLAAFTIRDVDRPASADGYFHVAGRWFIPAGPALVKAAGSASGTSALATLTSAHPAQAHTAGAAPQTGRIWRTAELLLLAPAVVKDRRVTLGVTMAFMLIVMM
jgi:hypothetical protein